MTVDSERLLRFVIYYSYPKDTFLNTQITLPGQ